MRTQPNALSPAVPPICAALECQDGDRCREVEWNRGQPSPRRLHRALVGHCQIAAHEDIDLMLP